MNLINEKYLYIKIKNFKLKKIYQIIIKLNIKFRHFPLLQHLSSSQPLPSLMAYY